MTGFLILINKNMKKITILSLIILITSNFCFSQEAKYARAYLFSTGFRDKNTNQIVWSENYKECDILIRFENNDLTIYSKTIQKYHVIKKTDSDNKSSVFSSVDKNGVICNFYIGKLDDGVIFLCVEYSDVSWIYLINME